MAGTEDGGGQPGIPRVLSSGLLWALAFCLWDVTKWSSEVEWLRREQGGAQLPWDTA